MKTRAGLAALLGLIALMGCATSPAAPARPAWPAWVDEPSHVAPGGDILALGCADGIQNAKLLEVTAKNRARNEAARLWQEGMAEATRAMGPNLHIDPEGQGVGMEMRAITNLAMEAVEVEDLWAEPGGGRGCARARLESRKFIGALRALPEQPAGIARALADYLEGAR